MAWATLGKISGSGFASAKIMGFFAMPLTNCASSAFFADTPINTSAPGMTSAKVLATDTGTARARLLSCKSFLSVSNTPVLSVMVIFFAPINLSNFAHEQPAAPAPKNTILTVSNVLPCISKALSKAAATITAVPCWSS